MPTYPAATDGGGLALSNISLLEGTNAYMGVATLVNGTVTVNNNKVTATSRIFLTRQSTGGTPADVGISARVNGTSFTISSAAGDTSVIAWLLINPAA
jgi:hypothetical protein